MNWKDIKNLDLIIERLDHEEDMFYTSDEEFYTKVLEEWQKS